ncbi:MAG: OmpA family protein [Candidatus Competibacteraceae bacterium]|nr:OmpA family protein [Candidatus Competibacteraceae bacterium]
MKKFILCLMIALGGNTAHSQALAIEEANMLFDGGEYKSALEYFQSLVSQSKKPDTDWLYKIGECYRKLKNYSKAEQYFSGLLDNKDVPNEMYLFYGHVLRYLGNQKDALAMYEKYNTLQPGHPSIKNYMEGCRFAMQNTSNNPDYAVDQTNLSVDGLHLGATRLNNGIVFSKPSAVRDEKTKVTYQNYHLVFSEYDGSKFTEPKTLASNIQSNFFLGGPAATADGKLLFYSKNDSEKKFSSKEKYGKNNLSSAGVNTLNVFYSHNQNGNWSDPISLNINSAEYSSTHPNISPDGKKLIFISNKQGGKGGYDLYMSSKSGETWSSPEPLNDLNTPDDEMFPFLANDTTLYFSSTGHIGFGGSDIFVSIKRNGKWSKPQNMGRGINSEKDDFGLIVWEGRKGFLASNRNAEPGNDDFFSFEKVIHYKKGKGTVIDELTLAKMSDVTIEVYDEDGNLVGTVVTDKNGNYDFSQFDPDKKYTVKAKKKGYKDVEIDVDPATTDLNNLSIKMEPIVEKNVVFTFNDILFEYGKADLMSASMEILDRLADLLVKNPKASVELSAHTDSRGSDQANATLSQKRAESSVNYLIGKGVKKEQLVAKGYGETQLKNKCKNGVTCSEEEHAVNRRVEIKVLDVK